MIYDYGVGELQNWLVLEPKFNSRALGKCEVIMALGNGYMGMRSATEERYVGETRNTFIAGTFNRFNDNEVTELPNIPDVFQIDMTFDGLPFDLTTGEVIRYKRYINLKTGELFREVVWKSPDGKTYDLTFRRFASLANHHLAGQKVTITCRDGALNLTVHSGINGQVTNSGVQHFLEGSKRLFHQRILQMDQKTSESDLDIIVSCQHGFYVDDRNYAPSQLIQMDRRRIFFEYDVKAEAHQTITIEKLSYFVTSRDQESTSLSLEALKKSAVEALMQEFEKGYDFLMSESSKCWSESLWSKCPIEIDSEDGFDQLAVRFAQYHLRIMTPLHDERMNIGAKGLTGEGYKGHTFWDTEIFILPYYSYTQPSVARQLLKYRYLSLDGARKKAKENGYQGAMYPWESAWLDDGEVTPVWGAADIVTGESTKIWSGFIEQHITSDIAFAVWQYDQITNDESFMRSYGYEIIFETATFWCSRLELDDRDGLYHINQVVGPDEYKEHVDDNAFTNYMAEFNIQAAIHYSDKLRKQHPEDWNRLNQKLNLSKVEKEWIEKRSKLYLPMPNADLVIPQDRTYLSKPLIDLTAYKKSSHVGSIFRAYNLEQVNALQVSKQADVLILMYLLESKFSHEIKKANWEYYEPKTLHDSSLSLSTHVIMATDLGHDETAYELFRRAAEIDLGPKLHSSDHGIHAASLGGIWQSVVIGFGGIRMIHGKLRVAPHLPKNWRSLKFNVLWHGEELSFIITQNEIRIKKALPQSQIEVEVFGKHYVFGEEARIIYGDRFV